MTALAPLRPASNLAGMRRTLHLKIRFGLARLPIFPVCYRLRTSGLPDLRFLWTRVIPFMDPARGAFDFELYGWDTRELRFLRRFLRPGMAVADIGAHHGLYSITAARCVGPSGRVDAFEPSPAAFRRLRWHLRLNRAGGVAAHPYAIADRRARSTLHVPAGGVDTLSSLRPPGVGRGRVRRVEVDVLPLDEAAERGGWPGLDLVKLDAEGAEAAVLDGAPRVIARHRPIWLFEALDATSAAWGLSGQALVERFCRLDCLIFEFTPTGWLRPHAPRVAYPLQRNCNLLAAPRDRAEAVACLAAADPTDA